MSNVVDLDRYRFEKQRAEQIESLRDILLALRGAYEILDPFVKYPLVSSISTGILEARRMVVENIERLQEQERNDQI